MYDLILENADGDQMTFGMGSRFQIVEIQGLNPPSATINVSQVSLMDGAKFQSSKLNMRTVMIAFAIEGDPPTSREAMYGVLRAKQWIKIYYNGKVRKVFTEGYIESIGVSYFAIKQVVTVTIICPNPYLQQAQLIVDELSSIISLFHFPFPTEDDIVFGVYNNAIGTTVKNDGDVSCGLIITLRAVEAVSDPKIYNYITRDFIGLEINLQAEDVITIDTRQGHRTATLTRAGVTTNVFNNVLSNSTWLQLEPNGSTFVYEVGTGDEADLVVTFSHYNLFEGV